MGMTSANLVNASVMHKMNLSVQKFLKAQTNQHEYTHADPIKVAAEAWIWHKFFSYLTLHT